MTIRRTVAVVAAIVSLAARGAAAQGWELRGVAGLYQPTTDQALHTDATTGQGTVYRLGTTFAYGARATAWLSKVFGLEIAGMFAAPTRTVDAAVTTTSASTISMLSVGAVRKFRLGETTALRFGAGWAYITVGGESYDSATVPLETATRGLNISAAVTRTLSSKLLLVAGIDDWMYQLDEVRSAPTLVTSGTTEKRQHDLVISLGIAARF